MQSFGSQISNWPSGKVLHLELSWRFPRNHQGFWKFSQLVHWLSLSTVPGTCRIFAKAHWSSSGSSWWPSTFLKHFMLFVPSTVTCLQIPVYLTESAYFSLYVPLNIFGNRTDYSELKQHESWYRYDNSNTDHEPRNVLRRDAPDAGYKISFDIFTFLSCVGIIYFHRTGVSNPVSTVENKDELVARTDLQRSIFCLYFHLHFQKQKLQMKCEKSAA